MKAKVIITFTVTKNLNDYDLVDSKKITVKGAKEILKEDMEDIELLVDELLLSKYKVIVK